MDTSMDLEGLEDQQCVALVLQQCRNMETTVRSIGNEVFMLVVCGLIVLAFMYYDSQRKMSQLLEQQSQKIEDLKVVLPS